MPSRKSWLEISELRLRGNYSALVSSASADGRNIAVLAVVKAGAYGHGATVCAPVLASMHAPWLGVTDAKEGLQVRRSLEETFGPDQIQPRILVMCGLLSDEVETIAVNQLTPVIWSQQHLASLADAVRQSRALSVHVEIDTGMSRQGVLPGAPLDLLLDDLRRRPELHLEGVLTHFASPELARSPLTATQQDRFEAALTQIADRGFRPEWIHVGNSSTLNDASALPWLEAIAERNGAQPMLRSGLALYGYLLPTEGSLATLRHLLSPVLTWKTRILSLGEIAEGATVGYNATFIAPQSMRLALLPVGYADGLRRELSGTNSHAGGWVMIRGQRAPIVGRISMNLTTVDVTAILGTALGDEVILLGEGVTAEDHARIAHTISYEILCGLRAPPELTT